MQFHPYHMGCPVRLPTPGSARLSLLGPGSRQREEPVLQDLPETQRTKVCFASTCLTDFLLLLYFWFLWISCFYVNPAIHLIKRIPWEFPGGPVVRTLRFHSHGLGFDPWSGN